MDKAGNLISPEANPTDEEVARLQEIFKLDYEGKLEESLPDKEAFKARLAEIVEENAEALEKLK